MLLRSCCRVAAYLETSARPHHLEKMCLILTVTAPAKFRDRFAEACRKAGAFGLDIRIEHPPRWPWARERPVRAFISEDGGCACSLLGDDADWKAEAWAMRPEIVGALAQTLEVLTGDVTCDDVSFEALWIGDAPEQNVRVTARQLAAFAQSSALGTRTKYEIVRGSAGERGNDG